MINSLYTFIRPKSPCYDEKNKKDCSNRSYCREYGRNCCDAWVKYEKDLNEYRDKVDKFKKPTLSYISCNRHNYYCGGLHKYRNKLEKRVRKKR